MIAKFILLNDDNDNDRFCLMKTGARNFELQRASLLSCFKSISLRTFLHQARWWFRRRHDFDRDDNNDITKSADCKAPKIRDGNVTVVGKEATFTCKNRYRLSGKQQLRCVDGKWDGKVPRCVFSKFLHPSAPFIVIMLKGKRDFSWIESRKLHKAFGMNWALTWKFWKIQMKYFQSWIRYYNRKFVNCTSFAKVYKLLLSQCADNWHGALGLLIIYLTIITSFVEVYELLHSQWCDNWVGALGLLSHT